MPPLKSRLGPPPPKFLKKPPLMKKGDMRATREINKVEPRRVTKREEKGLYEIPTQIPHPDIICKRYGVDHGITRGGAAQYGHALTGRVPICSGPFAIQATPVPLLFLRAHSYPMPYSSRTIRKNARTWTSRCSPLFHRGGPADIITYSSAYYHNPHNTNYLSSVR